MRVLDPVQVLSIVIGRMEQRANALEGVHMQGCEQTAMELRKFSEMLKRARSYVAGQRGSTGESLERVASPVIEEPARRPRR